MQNRIKDDVERYKNFREIHGGSSVSRMSLKEYPEFVLSQGMIIIYQHFCVRERPTILTFSRLRCEIELLSAILGLIR